jgi:drug/metabolite transporter (DMT)-like permease
LAKRPAIPHPPDVRALPVTVAFWTPVRAGIALVLLAALLWSTSGVLIKSLRLESAAIAGVRAAIAGLTLAPFLRYLRPKALERGNALRLLVLLCAYTGTVLCFNFAIKWTTAANAIALVYTSPAWVFALTCLAERRMPGRLAIPIALVLAGVAVLLAEPVQGTSLRGNVLGLLAGACFGTFTFLITRLRQPAIALVSLCNLFAGTSLFLLFPAAFRWGEFSGSDWLVLGFLGVFQIAAGHVCFTAALQRIPATQASMLALGEPLLNPLWVFLFLGEVPSAHGFAGLAVILSGVFTDFWVRRSWEPAGPGARRR